MGHAWEQEATAGGEGPEVIGAVDETFWERLLLVCLDLPTGYLLREDAVEARRDATWQALVAQRLAALGAPVRYLGSDRAKALIQRAEQGLGGLRSPAVFPLVHDIVPRYALAIGATHVKETLTASGANCIVQWSRPVDGTTRYCSAHRHGSRRACHP